MGGRSREGGGAAVRAIRKLSKVLKVIGVVLLCLSIVFTIYSVANTGATWATMQQALTDHGVQTGLMDRLRYDSAMFSAMGDAALSTKTATVRSAAIKANFAYFSDKADAAAPALTEAALQKAADYLDNTFDRDAFLTRYENREALEDESEAADALEYLNSLSTPTAKSGKKLPALKNASVESDLDAHYATLTAEHSEEETGTRAEYIQVIERMIKADIAAGASVTDVKAWLSDTFTWENYTAAFTAMNNEEKAENTGLSDRMAVALEEGTLNGRAFLEDSYAKLQAAYPNRTLPDIGVYAETAVSLLESASFDGTARSELSAVSTAGSKVVTFSSALGSLCDTLVSEADQRAAIGVIGAFWKIVSLTWLWWILAIVLIVAAVVIRRMQVRTLVNRLAKEEFHPADDDVLLRVEHMKQYFRSGSFISKAVDDVSFTIRKGEVFGLVGESGCGKTTTGRTIINLYDPTDGDVYFHGLRISSTMNGLPTYRRQRRADMKEAIRVLNNTLKEEGSRHPETKETLAAETKRKIAEEKAACREDIRRAEIHALESDAEKSRCVTLYRAQRKAALTAAYEEDMKTLTGTAAEERRRRYETEMKLAAKTNVMSRMQMIFQDPIASINPRMTVREIIAEGLTIRGVTDKEYIDKRVNEMLDLVGLVREHADRYPHEFSGGQRQRIGIARAIIMEPDLIIADEPISALDVSIQAQVINLMNDLRNNMGLTIMFIAHNLSVVKYFSDRIGVMYFGHLVELADSEELFRHPLHPYTKSLLSAIPYPDPNHEKHRQRIAYDPNKAHDYSVDKPALHEIVPGHFIHCNEAELARYREEMGL